MRRYSRLATVVLPILLTLTAAAYAGGRTETTEGDNSPSEQTIPAGDVLTVGLPEEPRSLFSPLMDQRIAEMAIAPNLYDPLLTFAADSSDPVPHLAESWSLSPDLTTYTFAIRTDVTFHNGEELAADDVVFTFETILDDRTGSPYSDEFEMVTAVRAADEHTVVFELHDPYAPFLRALAMANIGILPKDTLTEVGTDAFSRAPVGTGPFSFVEWARGNRLVLEKNETYFLGTPGLDAVVFRFVRRQEALVSDVLDGRVDVALGLDADGVSTIRTATSDGSTRVSILSVSGLRLRVLGFSEESMPFADQRFREAVCRTLDVDAAVAEAWGPGATRAYGWIPPSVTGGEETELRRYAVSADEDRAAELFAELREEGVLSADSELTLFTVEDPAREVFARTLAEALSRFDLDLSVEALPMVDLVPRLESGVGMYLIGWRTLPDAHRWMFKPFHSSSARNFSRVDDADIDLMLEEAKELHDEIDRTDRYQRVLHRILGTYTHIPLVWIDTTAAVGPAVQGLLLRPSGELPLMTAHGAVTLDPERDDSER